MCEALLAWAVLGNCGSWNLLLVRCALVRNIHPNLQLSEADGDFPVALTGRVYVYVDAGYGEVQPGDLLTTSATPGHAMVVTGYEAAQGAILGKAMTGLTAGRGLVLVLVSLQ